VPRTVEEAVGLAAREGQRVEARSTQAGLEAMETDASESRATYIKEKMLQQILSVALQTNPWISGSGDEAWSATAAEVNRQLGTQSRPITARKVRERVSEMLADYKKRQAAGSRSGHEPEAKTHDGLLQQILELIEHNKVSLGITSPQAAAKKVRMRGSAFRLLVTPTLVHVECRQRRTNARREERYYDHRLMFDRQTFKMMLTPQPNVRRAKWMQRWSVWRQ
jgi:hypothetical protein